MLPVDQRRAVDAEDAGGLTLRQAAQEPRLEHPFPLGRQPLAPKLLDEEPGLQFVVGARRVGEGFVGRRGAPARSRRKRRRWSRALWVATRVSQAPRLPPWKFARSVASLKSR